MKFLKKTYIQRALEEEAQGHYKQAAALYSKAGEFEKVGEMYELLGDMARSFSAKVREYQQAIRWYKHPEHSEHIAEKLAKTMEAEIRADAKISAIELHRLPKVAEYYAMAKQWKEAGRIYEEIGMYDEAMQMYVQGGAIEQVERIAGQKEEHNHRVYTAQQYYEDAVSYSKKGQRDKAYQSLKQCVTLDATHAEARPMLESLVQALQATDTRRVSIPMEDREYILFGKYVVTIGRKEDNDIILTPDDVSRHHARIGFNQQSVVVEDLQSSNGTRLNGLKIKQTAVLHDHDVLGFGLSMQFEMRIRSDASNISAQLSPLEKLAVQRHYVIFSGEIHIGLLDECDLQVHYVPPTSPSCLFKINYCQPYWYLHIHPQLTDVELNGNPVSDYIVVTSGDTVRFSGAELIFS